ncbi:uncharacterized protein LOC143263815 [Megalopta genalis]|uniref:uncharacterized protein LOC143263815 n=1 Tax=Megalopta genalis TaxID=115081 RepID=UPI003FD2AAFC
MRELNLKACLGRDLTEAIAKLGEKAAIYQKKPEISEQRREYRRQNQSFELYRSNFYRNLEESEVVEHQVKNVEIKNFWSKMWEEDNEEMNETDLKEYLFEFIPAENEVNTFLLYNEFTEIIKYLPNWKTAGCDGIYNFFIKKCELLHPFLYDIMREMCIEGKIGEPWLYKGITYLIPKGTLTKGGDFRQTFETKKFFKTIGLEVNQEKSATNSERCEQDAVKSEGTQGYKYLGITEDATSAVKKETFEKVKAEVLKRTETICKTKLNGKNMIKVINEYAISPACKERLYFPRTEIGRGLINVEHRSEYMLFDINQNFNETRNNNLRCSAILKVEEENETHLAAIDKYLNIKYGKQMLSVRDILEVQKETLYNKIKYKNNHKKLYNVRDNELVSIKGSPTWLTKGNNQARSEATYCSLEDRNIFCGQETICPHCRKQRKTVDHLATKYDCMLGFDYTRKHNKVVRCIHLLLCKKYGFKKSNKIRSHSVQEILKNENAEK